MKLFADLILGARRLRIATSLALLLVLAITLYAVVLASIGGGTGMFRLSSGGVEDRQALLVAAAAGLPFALGLLRLIRMLRRVERGEVFTRGTIDDLRGFTSFVLISALVSILLPAALAIGHALAAGGAERQVTLTFDGGDFFALLVSGLLFFVARLLGEAQRIADDASQIV